MAVALPETHLAPFLRRSRRGSGVVAPPPLGAFLAETLELGVRLVPAEAASLLLDDPIARRAQRGSPLTFVAALGTHATHVVGLEVPHGQGFAGKAYRTGTTLTSVTAAREKLFMRGIDVRTKVRTRSVVATPVRLEKAVCGVLELVNRRGQRTFSARDVELVELIAHYISRAILNAIDVRRQNEMLLFDELTGLHNVRMLEPSLSREILNATKRGRDLAVLFVDVDRLKRINDSFGHRAGNEALRRAGHAIAGAMGGVGRGYRFGGDEFVLVCPDANAKLASKIAEDLLARVSEATRGVVEVGARMSPVTVSVGIATLRSNVPATQRRDVSGTVLTLLGAADRALYRAKRGGRARIAIA